MPIDSSRLNGFEDFPLSEMTLQQALKHARVALSAMTWKPWKWSQICVDLPAAWWIAGHAIECLQEVEW